MTTLKITKATVVTGRGPDTVLLDTNLPQSMWPGTGFATVKFETPPNKGVDYVWTHLGLRADVIKAAG